MLIQVGMVKYNEQNVGQMLVMILLIRNEFADTFI